MDWTVVDVTDAEIVAEALKAYMRHKEWQAKKHPTKPGYQKHPVPIASDVLDASLDILNMPAWDREHQWCVWADEVINLAEGDPHRKLQR